MKHKGTILLKTPRLILRRFAEADIEPSFRNWAGDHLVTEFLRWQTHSDASVTARVLGNWITQYSDDKFYQWAIVPKDLNEPIGTISVVELKERIDTVHIGYCIGSAYWNRGYTSEALGALIKFFFEEVRAQRIESQHDPENPNSGKVMQKCGMKYEGTLRRADWSNRGIVDASMHAILVEEYCRE